MTNRELTASLYPGYRSPLNLKKALCHNNYLIPQITVLDAGGQYCHLIARKVRELGVYADVAPSEIRAADLAGRKGVIISGGPSSVYDPGSPTIDPALLSSGIPVLGICYGEQLDRAPFARTQAASTSGEHGEYGFAQLDITERRCNSARRRRDPSRSG